MKQNHLYIHAIAIVLICLSGCSLSTSGASMVWIDAPLDGAEIASGSTVQVHAHANNPAGIAEMMLLINGTAYRREAPFSPGEAFTEIDLAWYAEEPGVYTLIVEAFDSAGNSNQSAPVTVTVLEGIQAPIPDSTTNLTATFTADLTVLDTGQCTTLRWQTTNATSVVLDGASVDPIGTKLVCPPATTTYQMLVNKDAEAIDRSVTITVNPVIPADNAGPSILSVSHSPSFIWDGTNCGPTVATITASISDPAGVGSVILHYRVVTNSTQGIWQTITMSSGVGGYTATLGPAELRASLEYYGDGMVEYYISAYDSLGNASQSSTFQFEARLCFG